MDPTDSNPPLHFPSNSKERRQRYGLECRGPFGDGITFHGGTWVPGGEYVQTLVVKNVSTKMKKVSVETSGVNSSHPRPGKDRKNASAPTIPSNLRPSSFSSQVKYRLPRTRFFSLLYPLDIKLSPGTSQEFEVFFRPTRAEPYEDTIYFKLQEGEDSGGFHVPVRAYISTLQCDAPVGLDMGLLPINVTSPQTFRIDNIGEVPAPFEWKGRYALFVSLVLSTLTPPPTPHTQSPHPSLSNPPEASCQ